MLIFLPLIFQIVHSCSSSRGFKLFKGLLINSLETPQAPNCDIAGDLNHRQNVVRYLFVESLRRPATIGTFTDLSISSSHVDVVCSNQRASRIVYCTIKADDIFLSFRKLVRLIVFYLLQHCFLKFGKWRHHEEMAGVQAINHDNHNAYTLEWKLKICPLIVVLNMLGEV